MANELKIAEKFFLSRVGTIYMVKIQKGAKVQLGDVFCDEKGNRFKVKGIEMNRSLTGIPFDEKPTGLRFEELDGAEVSGDVLVAEVDD